MKVRFKLLDKVHAKLPVYKHQGDSGMDVFATEERDLGPGEHAMFSLGIAAEIPDGYELQVRPRSGLASKGVIAAFGTIDCKYRGEIKVNLFNHCSSNYHVTIGDRIAQLVLSPVTCAEIVETDTIDEATERGKGGFGSTGPDTMDYSNRKEREDKAKAIAARYADLYATANRKPINKAVLCIIMQIMATAHDHDGADHPIDLERLERQSDVDFIHDIMGSVANFSLQSCTFKNKFIPRCGFFKVKKEGK